MMKISDPIMFGHAVSVFYKDALDKHAAVLKELGCQPQQRPGRPATPRSRPCPQAKRAEIEADIKAVYAKRPALAMVDSDKGITNLHVPSDIIVDASMPVVVRESGQMWGPDGKLHETKAMIPDRCYATTYKTIIEDCRQHGAFDPATMGSVPNVGLMAQKAEEYGSHPTTFEIPFDGTVRVVDGRRHGAHGAPGRGGRHLAHVPGQGHPDPGLGQAGRQAGPGDRRPGRVLAGPQPGP